MVYVNKVLLVIRGDHASAVLPHLKNVQTWTRAPKGELRNLSVEVEPDRIAVSGSLPAFAEGSAAKVLAPKDVRYALHCIASDLGLDVRDVLAAEVMRLDIGANLFVSRPPDEYFRALVDVPRTPRRLKEIGVFFTTRRRQLAFYDAAEDLRYRGYPVPRSWDGSNVLRYELRLFREVYREFRGGVQAWQLTDPLFHLGLANRWRDRFNTVQRHRPDRMDEVATTADLRDALALHGIEAKGGVPAVLRMINDARASGLLTPRRASRLRVWLRTITTSPSLTQESELSKELRRTVRQASQNAALHLARPLRRT